MITIDKASSAVTRRLHLRWRHFYLRRHHAGGSAVVSGAGIVTGSAVLTYSGDQVNAGSYTVTAHYAGHANHTGSSGSATITIGKANAVITIVP